MRRKSFDRLISVIGLLLTAILIVAGGLLTWAHNFVGDQVHDQLAAQQIYFPPKGSDATKGDEFAPMRQYAGQQLTTGPQAKAYANHFIKVHLSEAAKGQTYSEVSGQYLAQCSDPSKASSAACQQLGGLRVTALATGAKYI